MEWRPPFTSVEPEPRQGGEAVRAYLAPDMFEEQAAEPVEEVEEGNRVAARLRARGRGSGIELDQTAFTGPSSAIGPCASRSTSTAEAFAAFSGESETS